MQEQNSSQTSVPAADELAGQRDERLAALLSQLTDQLKRGGRPDVEAILAEHTDLAEDLRSLWAAALVAQQSDPDARDFAYTAGLLHGIGQLAMFEDSKEYPTLVERAYAEGLELLTLERAFTGSNFFADNCPAHRRQSRRGLQPAQEADAEG